MRLLLLGLSIIFVFSLAAPFGNQSREQEGSNSALIVPGQRVGQLKLGDTRARALELFPYKRDMDQEWPEGDDCGTTINWLDMKNSKMLGNVFIRFKGNKVFQIDSGTTSFHTADGITVSSSPQEIRKKYPGLRAYILSNGSSEASGGRPLVYWLDADRGIAFGFTGGRRDHKHYLNWIIVFKPHAEVCPEYGPLGPSDKRELLPYSLETSPR